MSYQFLPQEKHRHRPIDERVLSEGGDQRPPDGQPGVGRGGERLQGDGQRGRREHRTATGGQEERSETCSNTSRMITACISNIAGRPLQGISAQT